MKIILNNYFSTNQRRILTALILTGVLSIGSGLTLLKSATAAHTNIVPETANEILGQNIIKNRLPRWVANAVLQDLSQRIKIPIKKLRIIEYSQQTWRNGCLELAQPDEVCTQALVSGWRVVVSDSNQNWIYHTNSNGRLLRVENSHTSINNLPENLPKSVVDAVLQAASERLQKPVSQLTIIKAQQQTWNDGCLELGNSNEICTQALVPGWQVTVRAVQTLVYHTNESGSVVKLNERAITDGNFSFGKANVT